MSISRLRRRGGRVRCFRHQRCGNCRAWLGGRPSAAVPHSFPSHLLLLLSCFPHFLVLSFFANLTTSFWCILLNSLRRGRGGAGGFCVCLESYITGAVFSRR